MNVRSINNSQPIKPIPSFKAHFVTLSKKNLGEKIAQNVVDVFNDSILPVIKNTANKEAQDIISLSGKGEIISSPKDFHNNVNFFTLAGGSGSRFRELAQTVGDYNKISLPLKISENQNIHMLDFALAMGKSFIDNNGVQKIIAENPSGSFGDVIMHYLKGNPIKDTVVCCGDNIFGDNATEIMSFITKAINNPNKHLALIGAGKSPEIVANRFGCLAAIKNPDGLGLKSMVEKPPLEVAKNIAIDGENIANTGLFYISKKALNNIVDELKNGINNIKKNDAEPYDFAIACKYVHSKIQNWFGIAPHDASDIKVVKKWEDVGEPKALYTFMNDVKKGEYISNFPKEIQEKITTSFNKRMMLDEKIPYINFTNSIKVSDNMIANAKDIEGVKIIV